MARRTLSLYSAFCLLVVAFFGGPPAAPVLVCRMTGRPMAPVAATPANHRSCCAVAANETDSGTRYTLTSPGCCDLRFTAHGKLPSATPTHAPDLSVPVAWLATPVVLTPPSTVAVVRPAATFHQDAPRGPPCYTSSPRAPPIS